MQLCVSSPKKARAVFSTSPDDVLDQLKTKHQSPAKILKESLLYGSINQIQVPYLKHTFPSTKTPFLEQLAQGRHALTLISSDAFYHQITFPKKGNISERKYSLICQKNRNNTIRSFYSGNLRRQSSDPYR